jgi:hypothetical protein
LEPSKENQQRAEEDFAFLEFLRFVLLPGAKGKALDTFLFPSWTFAAGVFYLLIADDLSRDIGWILFLILLYQFIISVTVALLLRRILAYVHEWHPELAWGIFATVAVAMLLVGGAIKRHEAKKSRAHEAAIAEIQEARSRSAEEAQVTERNLAQAERDARVALIERWRLARSNAIGTWRKQLVADGAVGGRGVSPPMLDVQDDGKRVNVTNRAANAACVLLSRIATNESGRIERCAVSGYQCVVIPPGETRRLATLLAGNPQSCLAGELEFRVGSVDHPDPSWWSETAFTNFTEVADTETVSRWSDERLLAEVTRLEKQVQVRMRVDR